MPRKKSAQLQREISAALKGRFAPRVHHARAKEQTYRIEVRFDFHGTQAAAERRAMEVSSQVGGEVTAIFDEQFEEI
jgi:hypothetical protein